ncbi:phage antirepressor KilAC domain-containing protein [Parabacteroides sp. GYB001]|uniref:phage antirepressor KilAC domain-containing protein n=1 Tax=Parabacteroides leei TaxID=2939491 RepID=UPI0020179209|nr:phage antirepressor KilAC domain-containing protein [Parabacteroides leei]MCL3851440.1 phage antirepressor KilAC domain-containing protein [Parabacteroides leei]
MELSNNGFYYFDYKGAKIPYCEYEKRVYVECKGLSTVVGTGVAVWLRDNRDIVNSYASEHNMKINKCVIGATILLLELALMYFRSSNSELAEWVESQELTFGEKPEVKVLSDRVELIQTATLLGKQIDVYGSVEEPLFLAKDVAQWIEYDSESINKMLQSVEEEEKVTGTIFRSGQNRQMWLLTEDGIYELLMQSRKPIAKKFKKGIKEILRTIRTTGGYMATRADDTPDEIMARALLLAQDTLKKRERRIVELQSQNTRLSETVELQANELKMVAPKVEYHDTVLQSDNTSTSTQVAKDFGLKSAKELHNRLKKMGIMYKQSGQWLLTAKYCGKGYTKPRTTTYIKSDGSSGTNTITVWTEKGREFVYSLLNTN